MDFHSGDAVYLLPGLHAARAGHDNDAFASDLDIADPDHGAAGAKAAADQLVGRSDAMGVLDALHHLEIGGFEIARAHAAEHRVEHSRGPVHVEAELDEPVDHRLNLRFAGAFLHDD